VYERLVTCQQVSTTGGPLPNRHATALAVAPPEYPLLDRRSGEQVYPGHRLGDMPVGSIDVGVQEAELWRGVPVAASGEGAPHSFEALGGWGAIAAMPGMPYM
jgi:hypothetical protein